MPVTNDSKKILKSLLNISADKCQILHLGVNTEIFFRSRLLRASYRNLLQISDDCMLIISAGKFHEGKDIDFLLSVYADINKECRNTKLLLLGGGDNNYMGKLSDLVKSLNLNDYVIFHEFVKNSELPAYYNAADIGVWPGAHSITAIESIATGLPIIVPEHNLAYKILLENDVAVGYIRGDSESLKNSMLSLLKNKELRQNMCKKCLNVSNEILSWEKVASLSIKIYQNKT